MAKLIKLMWVTIIGGFCMLSGLQSSAEDTEIYQAVFSPTDSSTRPKVLIIFDNSGSMVTNSVTSQLQTYDPTFDYPDQGYSDSRIYWSLTDTSRYFDADSNRCAESITPLADTGQYSSVFKTYRRYRWWSSNRRWDNLNDASYTRDSDYIDCLGDEIEDNQSNPGTPSQINGYPTDSSGPYQADTKTLNWGTNNQILYSANYLNYYNDDTGTYFETRTRLAVAQDVVTDIIASNTSIDFGLMVFNRNYSTTNNGGRVIKHLETDMSDTARDDLVTTVDDLVDSLYTPLCETSYEAYRYLTGSSVMYGNLAYSSDTPDKDTNAEDADGDYISPTTDCAYTYIILMTDGEPTRDTSADDAIEELIDNNCSGNCLDEITEYMATHDLDGDSDNGNQYAYTYTIGFATDQQLLEDAAEKGQGEYFTADNSEELTNAFQGAISEILSSESSFTSPAVAVDTFSRTESRNEVFFAMFKPSQEVNWKGNIKRLNLVLEDGDAVLKDANANDAFEPCPNNVDDDITECIAEDAQTVWSTTNDGGIVDQGGVGSLLVSRNTARVLYSNTGASNALDDLDDTYDNRLLSGYADDDELFSAFGVTTEAELTAMLSWARGNDVDNEVADSDVQEWIMADMLHSRPVVVNYGARGSATVTSPDQRLVVGTNGGFLHMFDVDNGQEDWAFFPKELSSILTLRRGNERSVDHVYGIDAPPVIYLNDINKDGTIDSTANEQAIVYFGLRRGGRAMYALDISNPDSPSHKWQIDETSTGFSELGQTWSVPAISTIPGYTYDHDSDNDTPVVPKPVLIFGAGYDPNKDSTGIGTADSMGRGIFIVDALDGTLVWSITPAANSATNMQNTGLTDSVPAIVTPVDSNGDGISDRIYFGDTGGNLWRVDMPALTNNARPDSSQDSWFLTKLADINGGTTATDRRFFSSPDVVRTKNRVCTEYDEDTGECETVTTINYDAVLIGTGDRTNPAATDVDNQFYMFRDRRLQPYTEAPQTETECNFVPGVNDDPLSYDFRCELNSGAGLSTSSLYDATANLIQDGTDEQKISASAALEGAHGWRINLSGNGEKSLARSLTLFGTVFFTTFIPESNSELSCMPAAGTGYLYRVNLQDATKVRSPHNDRTYYDRITELGSLVPDTPSPHFGSDKKIRLLFPSGGGPQAMDSDSTMPQPYGIYWYREEQ